MMTWETVCPDFVFKKFGLESQKERTGRSSWTSRLDYPFA